MLLSIVVFCTLRITIDSDQLLYIRTQQIFGLIAIIFLYCAVILTPLSKLMGKGRLANALFARRAVGVSAAYFSVLHIVVALADQVGGLANLSLLPERFKVAFLLGALAATVLLLMAATSFDKVIKAMTFPRWKILHRFVYLAGVLIIVHIWLIGTHATDSPTKIMGSLALAVLFSLQATRIARWCAQKYSLTTVKAALAGTATFTVMMASLLLLPLMSANYHDDHHSEGISESGEQ